MHLSSPDKYLRSRLAYSFLTLSPWHTALTVFLAVLSICTFLSKFLKIEDDHYLVVFIVDLFVAPVIVWCVYAWIRWIPRHVVIPKRAHAGVPEHLGGRVMLMSESVLDVEGCPVLAYNTNHYVGGQAGPGGQGPNLMAQFMAKYFNGDAEHYTYDFNLFLECYRDSKTRLFATDGTMLDKVDYVEPREFHPGIVAEKGEKPDLPRGAVLALYLKQSEGKPGLPPYAFFLATTWVEIGRRIPHSDLMTLFSALKTLWISADIVLDSPTSLCLPCLGSGGGHLKDGVYSSLWAIVASYRSAYQAEAPDHSLRLCMLPRQLRRYDLREVLKLMTYALCNS